MFPTSVCIIRCNEESQKLRRSIHQQEEDDNNKNRIQWFDALSLNNNNSNNNITNFPPFLQSFSTVCESFTSISALSDQRARHYFDVSAPAAVTIVQAKKTTTTTINEQHHQQQQHCSYEAGSPFWCVTVMMPGLHFRQGQKSSSSSSNTATAPLKDIVCITLCVFIFPHEVVTLMDSILAACTSTCRTIDTSLGHDQKSASTPNQNCAEAYKQLVALPSTSIPRDVQHFCPSARNDAWSGAPTRPPHAMIPLAQFVQMFNYAELLQLFSLACQEASILFVHSSPSVASQCCVAMRGLLYPVAWTHHFVPILTPSPSSSSCSTTTTTTNSQKLSLFSWPFPLTRTVSGTAFPNAFLAGITNTDLPALLLDHSNTNSCCELWIADCREGTISRATPSVQLSRFAIHHPQIVNLLLPSNVFLRDAWEHARENLSRNVSASTKEHFRVIPETRLNLIQAVTGYWAETMFGQYRIGLSIPRSKIDFDAFFYKLLLSSTLSGSALEPDPEGSIRALSIIIKKSQMIENAFYKSMFSLEMLANANARHYTSHRGSTTTTTTTTMVESVPFWRWGFGSSNAVQKIPSKENHDMYFFFRKCCEKFPDLYRDDPTTANKIKENSGFFSKVEGFFTKAKDSVRASISDFSLDRHFSVLIPYLSLPTGNLKLWKVKPSGETVSSPKTSSMGVGFSATTNSASASTSSSSSSSQQQQQQHQHHSLSQHLTAQDNAKIEAQCRFFPPSHHNKHNNNEHWSQIWPHAKHYTTKYEMSQRSPGGGYELAPPLPCDILCDFSSYHNLLAPEGATPSSPVFISPQQFVSSPVASSTSTSNTTNTNNAASAAITVVPEELLKVISTTSKSSNNNNTAATTTMSSTSANNNTNPNVPDLFSKISVPVNRTSPTTTTTTSPTTITTTTTVFQQSSKPTMEQQQQNQQLDQKKEEEKKENSNANNNTNISMTALFGPSVEEQEAEKKKNIMSKKSPVLDDFFS